MKSKSIVKSLIIFIVILSIPFLTGCKNKIARMGLKGKFTYEAWGKAVKILDLETGKYKRIYVGEKAYDPEVSPDGKKIAYVTIGEGYFLKMFNIKTKAKKSFGNKICARCPRWSPDGKKIVFFSNRLEIGGPMGLYILDAESGKEELITDADNEPDSWGSWSPDGKKIIFCKYGRGNFVIDVSSKKISSLVCSEKFTRDPCFSPDGSKIAYYSVDNGRNNIFIVDIDGKNKKKLTNCSRETVYGCVSPRWTQDGRKIIYCKHPMDYFPLFQSISYLYVMNPDGTDKIKIKKFWF